MFREPWDALGGNRDYIITVETIQRHLERLEYPQHSFLSEGKKSRKVKTLVR